MATSATSSGGTDTGTLQPSEKLAQLRADLKTQPDLRKELTENPSAVLTKYGLSLSLPTGTISRIRARGGFAFPAEGAKHIDDHWDTAHIDFKPHMGQNLHVDIVQ
jgi:hypothetical protein